MKKIFIPVILFAAATAVSSCSDDLQNAEVTTDVDMVGINVASGTTRGTDITTSALEGSSGVKLHIVDNNATNGAYDFTATGSDWSQKNSSLTWDDITFPAHFSSMHDGTPQELNATNNSSSLDYTISGASSTHKDLVYHSSKLEAIPTGGKINVFHKHALSKINLFAATNKNKVYIARVNFVNVDGDGTATITPVDAANLSITSGISWNLGTSNKVTYPYLTSASDLAVAAAPFQSSATGNNPVINDSANAPFMILPQTLSATTSMQIKNGGSSITGSYIELIYYMTDTADQPLIGYSSVKARPDYANFLASDYGKVLYVKAAFPVGYTFTDNKVYDISLGLGCAGSTGGLLLDDFYVDKDGNAVTLHDTDGNTTSPVDIPEIDEGDPILPNSSDLIDIIVSAHDWEDGGSIQLEH